MQAAEPAPLEPGRETVDSVVSDSQQETLEPPADAGLEDCALETYEIEEAFRRAWVAVESTVDDGAGQTAPADKAQGDSTVIAPPQAPARLQAAEGSEADAAVINSQTDAIVY